MKEQIAYCGMDCATCPAFIATKNNDQALKEKTAAEWSGEFEGQNYTHKPEDINCTGCKGSGAIFAHCTHCELRKCASSKNFATCKDCGDLKTCEIVKNFIAVFPDAADRLA